MGVGLARDGGPCTSRPVFALAVSLRAIRALLFFYDDNDDGDRKQLLIGNNDDLDIANNTQRV